MLGKIKTFWRLPNRVKLLFFEAWFTSAWVKLTLTLFPFQKVLGWMGNVRAESNHLADPATLEHRKQISMALRLCRQYAWWPAECYTMALTGKILLRRRRIASTLYIGFIKSPEGRFLGHAWLRACDTYITGYREAVGYSANLYFS